MNKKLLKNLGLAAGLALGSVGSAYAALPDGVTTEISNTQSNMNEVGALLVGLAVVAMGWRWLKAQFF